MGAALVARERMEIIAPETYSRWRGTSVGRITEALETALILELIGDVDGKRVLDVGCGDGKLAVALAARGASVIGVDTSARMLRVARERARSAGADVGFSMGRAESLPVADASVDVVAAVTVLCFIADAAPTFRELARVLRPGGRLTIGELGRFSTWAAQRRVRAWLGSPRWRQGRFRTARELERLARGAGLTPLEVRGAVYYPRCGLAARALAGRDARLGRLTTFGAAFIALTAASCATASCTS